MLRLCKYFTSFNVVYVYFTKTYAVYIKNLILAVTNNVPRIVFDCSKFDSLKNMDPILFSI
jgi:hypothetical protein